MMLFICMRCKCSIHQSETLLICTQVILIKRILYWTSPKLEEPPASTAKNTVGIAAVITGQCVLPRKPRCKNKNKISLQAMWKSNISAGDCFLKPGQPNTDAVKHNGNHITPKYHVRCRAQLSTVRGIYRCIYGPRCVSRIACHPNTPTPVSIMLQKRYKTF